MDSIDITLGEQRDLTQMFSAFDPNIELTDVLSHAFNQTLQRDMFFGSWADAYFHKADGLYHVKLTSPDQDLSLYETTVPGMIKAAKMAMDIFNAGQMTTTELRFYLPFGLAMSAYKSIQMLHFPPIEALDFTDYLYNPTCRRWELLLLHNGFDSKQNTLMERLLDLVPIAAPGGDSKDIDNYNLSFSLYVSTLLEMFLGANATEELTAPMVVGGAPAIHFIQDRYPDAIPRDTKLGVMSLVELKIIPNADGKSFKTTNLLCTNHPSTYLFELGDPDNEKGAMKVMREDLICAGWQAEMTGNWEADPKKVLKKMEERWKSDKKVKQIMHDSQPEWSFSN
jgi:hypothetical protein